MLRKYRSSIKYVIPSLLDLFFLNLDSLECDHIKLESGYVKSVEVKNKDNHGAGYESDKFAKN